MACEGRGTNTIVHPTAANDAGQADAQVSEDTLPAGLSLEALAEWQATKAAVLGAHVVLTLGRDDHDPEMFGIVADVAINAEGQIAVLDASVDEVGVFDADGRHLGRFGGIGDGPEELRRASSIEALSDGRFLVSARGRIKIFEPSAESWQVSASYDLPLLAIQNSCLAADNRLFVSSLHPTEKHAIREVAVENGVVVAGFGSGYLDPNPAARLHLSRGLVDCVSTASGIIFGSKLLSSVRRYALDGSLVWTTALTNHSVLRITENRTTSAITFDDSQPYDVLESVHATPSGRLVLIQYTRLFPNDLPESTRTYLLDIESGVGAALRKSVPPIVDVNAHGIVTVDGLHPVVKVWSVDW
ncbi:MAG: hypothetical protein J4F34_06580 [Gemmatimonadetes bacterium]|nr:hypothetical protein [Gemmatimonadota bacterium]